MKISESEIRKALEECYQRGFEGCLDLKEEVIEELMLKLKESCEEPKPFKKTHPVYSSYTTSTLSDQQYFSNLLNHAVDVNHAIDGRGRR